MGDIILKELADDLDSRLISEIMYYTFPGDSEKTVEAYQVDVKQFVIFCLKEEIPVWSKDSLPAFITRYKEENLHQELTFSSFIYVSPKLSTASPIKSVRDLHLFSFKADTY